MTMLSIVLDLLSIIPGVNWLTEIVAVIVYGIWFYILGLGVISLRKFVAPIIGLIIEAIPAISALPTITISIWVLYAMIRAEEKTGINATSVVSAGRGGGARPPRIPPINNAS